MNTWKRKALLLVSVPALALPGAIGIYHWLLPARGMIGAISASVGIELAYLGVSILALTDSELRRLATWVAWAAAIVSVAMNMLLDYGTRVPGGLASTSTFIATFDVLTLFIAALDSIPLAVLSLTSAMLLHRLSEADSDIRHAQHDAAMTSIQKLASQVADLGEKVNACEASIVLVAKPESEPVYECPNCLTELASKGQWMAAKKYGYCRHCKPVENGNGNGHHAQHESIEEMEVIA